MKFKMNRNFTVASRAGHTIAFVKDEPTYVPPALHREVVAAGGVACDGEVEFESKEKAVTAPSDPAERAELIAMACADIKKRDDRADFTASGTPKTKAVEAIVGFDISAKELADVWTAMNQAASE